MPTKTIEGEKGKTLSFRWPADYIPGPSCYVNKSLYYEFMNIKYKDMFNIDDETDITKLQVKDVLGEKFKEAEENINSVLKGTPILFEVDLNFAIIQVHYIPEYTIPNDKTSKIKGFFMMGIDVTELKKTQENYKNELEDEIQTKTKYLSDALKNLKKTQKLLIEQEKMAALGALVAGVSHELNTPLGIALTGVTHLDEISRELEKKYNKDNLEENDFKEYLSTTKQVTNQVLSNLEKVTTLINTFKKLSLAHEEEEIQLFNIYEYTEILILSISTKIKDKDIKINNNIPIKTIININQRAYGQIITNLVLNSIIHGFEDVNSGIININLEENDDKFILNYIDNGIGIECKDLPFIFDPFFTTKRSIGSPGLGLNIVYNTVISQLKGHIVCKSKKDEGVNFEIIFPKTL